MYELDGEFGPVMALLYLLWFLLLSRLHGIQLFPRYFTFFFSIFASLYLLIFLLVINRPDLFCTIFFSTYFSFPSTMLIYIQTILYNTENKSWINNTLQVDSIERRSIKICWKNSVIDALWILIFLKFLYRWHKKGNDSRNSSRSWMRNNWISSCHRSRVS